MHREALSYHGNRIVTTCRAQRAKESDGNYYNRTLRVSGPLRFQRGCTALVMLGLRPWRGGPQRADSPARGRRQLAPGQGPVGSAQSSEEVLCSETASLRGCMRRGLHVLEKLQTGINWGDTNEPPPRGVRSVAG